MAHLRRLVCIFIPVLAILLMSHNTYATSYQYWSSSVNLYRYSSDGDESITSTSTWTSNVSSSLYVDQGYSVGAYCFYFADMTANEGEYFTVAYGQKLYVGDVTTAVGVGGVSGRESIAVDWVDMSNTAYNTSGSQNRFVSYTVGGQFGADVSNWVCFNQVLQNTNTSLGFSMNFTKPSLTVYTSQDEYEAALAGIQSSLDTVNTNLEGISDLIEGLDVPSASEIGDAVNEPEEEASDNISSQSTDDMEDVENEQTTNIIGVVSSFLSAITSFSGSSCEMDLEFPDYAGGTMTVDVCQNRDKAGNIIAVFTSLTLILFYLPLAFKLLSMIYNEIRSFTNG